MGDFGSTYGQPLGRRGGRRRPAQQQLGGWVDPFDMLPGFDEDVFFNTPMLLGGGQGQQQKLTSGKEQEETKMIDVDEKSAQATQLTQQQPQVGTAMTTFQPDRLLRARVNIEDAKVSRQAHASARMARSSLGRLRVC